MTHPATAAVRHGSLLARHKLAFVLEIAGEQFRRIWCGLTEYDVVAEGSLACSKHFSEFSERLSAVCRVGMSFLAAY
jgi:hypothetical protein